MTQKRGKSPSFSECMKMMRKKDGLTKENGFYWILPHACLYVDDLISEFDNERQDIGLQCWLLELIGESKTQRGVDFLVKQLSHDREEFRYWAIEGLKLMDTKETRTLLWNMKDPKY